MDIRNIKTFVRVAELQSFTKAAEELGYVQSTVTMQIQQLEKELNYPLFDRIGKKVSLTSLGQEYLSCAYEILDVVEKTKNLGREPEMLQGTLRVGVLESLLFGVLMELLPAFREKYKNVSIQLKMGESAELLQQLKQNQLDMVYISSDLNTDPDLQCCCKRQERLAFLCAPTHPVAQEKKLPLDKILAHDLVATEHKGICYTRLRQLAAGHNARIRDSVEVDSTVVVIDMVKKGMGLGFLPEYAVSKQLQEGSLVKVDVDIPEQTLYSQVLCHKGRWISPFMTGFIDMVKAAAQGTQKFC